jgi:hypothetical protein
MDLAAKSEIREIGDADLVGELADPELAIFGL